METDAVVVTSEIKVLFRTSRQLTQAAGMEYWRYGRFGSAPGPCTYFLKMRGDGEVADGIATIDEIVKMLAEGDGVPEGEITILEHKVKSLR